MADAIVSPARRLPRRPSRRRWRWACQQQVPARQHLWRGASGRAYVHSVYSLIECPPLPKASYVLVRREADGRRVALHVGLGRSDTATLNLAQVRQRGAQLGANEVHVHFPARSDAEHAPGGLRSACRPVRLPCRRADAPRGLSGARPSAAASTSAIVSRETFWPNCGSRPAALSASLSRYRNRRRSSLRAAAARARRATAPPAPGPPRRGSPAAPPARRQASPPAIATSRSSSRSRMPSSIRCRTVLTR